MKAIASAIRRTGDVATGVVAVRCRVPGILVCVLCALAASFVSEHHGGPQLLYALLIGLAINFLANDDKLRPGIEFCARTALRTGVALLGARVTMGQIVHLGTATALQVGAAVLMTILFGIGLARVLGRPREEGVISGCAVGICGASAALTVASVLPQTRENERFTLLAIVGVTLFSTVAMVAYPALLAVLGLGGTAAGIFLGGTIHDVAQVVAAAMLLGPETADTATVVKLFRVAMLAPIAMGLAIAYRTRNSTSAGKKTPLVPWFLGVFLLLSAASSIGLAGPDAIAGATAASRWLLVVAIAAAGIKTNFADLRQLGWQPVVMLAGETVFIALLVTLSLKMVALPG